MQIPVRHRLQIPETKKASLYYINDYREIVSIAGKRRRSLIEITSNVSEPHPRYRNVAVISARDAFGVPRLGHFRPVSNETGSSRLKVTHIAKCGKTWPCVTLGRSLNVVEYGYREYRHFQPGVCKAAGHILPTAIQQPNDKLKCISGRTPAKQQESFYANIIRMSNPIPAEAAADKGHMISGHASQCSGIPKDFSQYLSE